MKQRVSVFRLNWNKQKSTVWYRAYFGIFFWIFRVVSVCFGLFRNSLFRFYTETESFDVSIEPKLTEGQQKQFKREHIVFEKVLFVSVVSIFIQNTETNRNKPKQTETFCFWFHETNQNTTETDLVSVCFGLNWNFLFFFRGHASKESTHWGGGGGWGNNLLSFVFANECCSLI